MRCLTLAEVLRENRCECRFISRPHKGNLIGQIERHGFPVSVLPDCPFESTVLEVAEKELAHAAWLGCDWQVDAQQTREALVGSQPDWLVVDHYALDARWEKQVLGANPRTRLLVIDDLADRPHACDLLLDQNLGRSGRDYDGLVPSACRLLIGPKYALLRPEFAAWRDYSLKRRRNPELKRLLVNMGGVDRPNTTGKVLETLKSCSLPSDCRITVVMGCKAPWLKRVETIAASLPWPADVRVDISDMAKVMAESDLAIGAAGSTSWERCCLGLPSICLATAQNQNEAANAMQGAGAVRLVRDAGDLDAIILEILEQNNGYAGLAKMSKVAAKLTCGRGVHLVSERIGNKV